MTATTAPTLTATVYLNTSVDAHGRSLGRMDGFRPEHTFRLGGSYLIPELLTRWASSERGMTLLAEHVFDVFNVGNDPEFFGIPVPEAVTYFNEGNPALSVGDLILIGETALSVDRRGFSVVALPESLRAI